MNNSINPFFEELIRYYKHCWDRDIIYNGFHRSIFVTQIVSRIEDELNENELEFYRSDFGYTVWRLDKDSRQELYWCVRFVMERYRRNMREGKAARFKDEDKYTLIHNLGIFSSSLVDHVKRTKVNSLKGDFLDEFEKGFSQNQVPGFIPFT